MTNIQAIHSTSFGSAAPKTGASIEPENGNGMEPATASTLEQYKMIRDHFQQNLAAKEAPVKMAENISNAMGVATMGSAMGLAGAWAMGAISGIEGWLLGGLLPAGLILIPMANRLVKGSAKVGNFLD